MSFFRMRSVPCLLALALALACSQKPAKVVVSPAKADLADEGGTVKLSVVVADAKGKPIAGAPVLYASGNPSVAEVDASGKVTARGSGDTEITATCGEASGTAAISVRLVRSLSLALHSEADIAATGASGSSYALRVTALNENGEPADLSKATWASSDPSVATVSPGGVLTLLKDGRTVISATIGKRKAECAVPVEIVIPLAIKIDEPPPPLKAGESAPLKYTVLSNKGGAMKVQATFASSDPEIVSVDEKGVITGHKRGTAQLTIQAGEGIHTVPVTVR